MRFLLANIFKRSALCLFILLLASCRIVQTNDGNGRIVSSSGAYDCSVATCEIDLSASFSDSFTAVADEGYTFEGWTTFCLQFGTDVCVVNIPWLIDTYPALAEIAFDFEITARFVAQTTGKSWYKDADGDNYGSPTETITAEQQPSGYVADNSDCNDAQASVNPGADELYDLLDNDCDDEIDEGFSLSTYYADSDGDGFGSLNSSKQAVEKPDGYVSDNTDCDDSNSAINTDATEVADSIDNNCDGEVDEGFSRFYPDSDSDGYGASENSVDATSAPAGYVSSNTDCDDNNAATYPDATEIFDSADNDCDGAIDEGLSVTTYYRDADGDGFGDSTDSRSDVTQPSGYVTNSTDNCAAVSNVSQADADGDGIGDACDSVDDTDTDADGVADASDNCPNDVNPTQTDSDSDGVGDSCDIVVVDGDCSMTAEDQLMLDTVNAARAQARSCGSEGSFVAVGALSWDCKLEAAAEVHSTDLATNDIFQHEGSDGSQVSDRATAAGYTWMSVGENLAAGVMLRGVAEAVQAWLDSDGHCANLMGASFTEFGSARVENNAAEYVAYWTQVFASPR